jgi:hypothetical protein
MTLTILTMAVAALLVGAGIADARDKADNGRFSAAERVLCHRSGCDIEPRVAE